jgi:hypothetical protein
MLHISIYLTLFTTKRLSDWRVIKDIEESVLFHDIIKSNFDAIENFKNIYDIQNFVEFWMNKDDQEILSSIPEKATIMYSVFKTNIDFNNDNNIDKKEFIQFCSIHNIIDIDKLWNLFSDNNTITKNKLENLLYSMCFNRKNFAYKLYTDFIIINLIITYINYALIGASIILLFYIWGYDNVFGAGVDLFKIYILAISFSANSMLPTINFLSYLLFERPFNIGDILLIDNSTYKVDTVSPTFIQCIGDTSITINNLSLNIINNLTSNLVFDNVYINVPFNFPYYIDTIQKTLQEYADLNDKDICNKTIRCGWSKTDTTSKIIQCNWKYNFIIHDRIRYNWVRTRIINHIFSVINNDIVNYSMVLGTSQSGAYANKLKFD